MAYIPKKYEKYDLLPACKRRGGEVFEYPSGLIDKINMMMDGEHSVFPYGFKSYEEYYACVDKAIEAYKDNEMLVEMLNRLKGRMHELNVKEEWSVLRYIGKSDGMVGGLTHGRVYFWPTTKKHPIYHGVIDDEEFTSYIFPTDESLWEILEDPTGMAKNTIFNNGEGCITSAEHESLLAQVKKLAEAED